MRVALVAGVVGARIAAAEPPPAPPPLRCEPAPFVDVMLGGANAEGKAGW